MAAVSYIAIEPFGVSATCRRKQCFYVSQVEKLPHLLLPHKGHEKTSNVCVYELQVLSQHHVTSKRRLL